jgi:enoyl-[acyl-carrier protein] reductase III
MINLQNYVALVTGGSRGIGRATAIRLAEAGADVVINYVTSQSNARTVADHIAGLGRRVATVKADVTEPEDIQSMVDFVGKEFGKIDILISNAASGGFRNVMDASTKHFEAAMKTNVQALMLLTQACVPWMTDTRHHRKIVAISSHGSHLALPAYGLIGASKAALESLARHLALEIGNQGINVNVVLAGLVATDSTRAFPGSEQAFAEVAKRRYVNGRELLPEEVANAILYLSSPLSDLVQGQTLVIDGGETLHG